MLMIKAEMQPTNLSIPQFSMKQGLQRFGQEGIDAAKVELLQLHNHKVVQAK